MTMETAEYISALTHMKCQVENSPTQNTPISPTMAASLDWEPDCSNMLGTLDRKLLPPCIHNR